MLEELLSILKCVFCGNRFLKICKPARGFDYMGEEINLCYRCENCGEEYPITNDGIPILWSVELKKSFKGEIIHCTAMFANKSAYDAFSDEYAEFTRQEDEIGLRISRAINVLIENACQASYGKNTLWQLDFGCGPGNVINWLSGFGFKQVGLDLSLANLRIAKRKSGALVVCGDASNMPFQDKAFDIVTESAVLHHILDWKRAIHEACRVCSGGILFDSEPSKDALDWKLPAKLIYDSRLFVYPALSKLLKKKFMFKDKETMRMNLEAEVHNQPGRGFDIEEIISVFNANGFTVEVIQSPDKDLKPRAMASWKSILLNMLSLHNPWNPRYYPFMVLAYAEKK